MFVNVFSCANKRHISLIHDTNYNNRYNLNTY